jgi:hypothetical protein
MENNKKNSTAKVVAIIVGALTLAWQVLQIINGKAINMFLIADIILGIALIAAALKANTKNGEIYLLIAFAFSAGVFATATFGGLTMGTYNFGAATTTLALIPCLFYTYTISKNL